MTTWDEGYKQATIDFRYRILRQLNLTKEEWLKFGVEKKWVSEPDCAVHNTFPTTEEEDKAYDNGKDYCLNAIRIFDTTEQADLALKNTLARRVTNDK